MNGYAVALEYQGGQSPVLWVGAYFRPGSQLVILKALTAALRRLNFFGRVCMGCDLNKTDALHSEAWEQFLAEFQLHDVSPGLPTYSVDHNSSSCLDRWLLRGTAIHQQFILPKTVASQRAGPGQHSRVYLNLRIARPPTKSPSFQRIPAKPVNPGTIEGQHLMRQLRRAIVPFTQGDDTQNHDGGSTECLPPAGVESASAHVSPGNRNGAFGDAEGT